MTEICLRLVYFRSFVQVIRPLLEYGGMVWDNCSQRDKDKIEDVQYLAGPIVSGAIKGTVRIRFIGTWMEVAIKL